MKILKKRRVRNHNNPRPPKSEEEATIPSITVPNMTLSLKELVSRHRLGQSVAVFDGNYEESGEYDHMTAGIESMDEMDRRDYLATLRTQNQVKAMELHRQQVRRKQEEEQAEQKKLAEAAVGSVEEQIKPTVPEEAKPQP